MKYFVLFFYFNSILNFLETLKNTFQDNLNYANKKFGNSFQSSLDFADSANGYRYLRRYLRAYLETKNKVIKISKIANSIKCY